MRIILSLSLLFSLIVPAYAGDTHQDTQGHAVTVAITDSNGDPVTNQSPRVAVKRVSDGLYLDHSDGTFKAASAATTLYGSMAFDQAGGFYMRVITIDQGILVSGDFVTIVSNDDSTYGFTAAESIEWDNLNNLIKIHR